jgi:hypothetical protein
MHEIMLGVLFVLIALIAIDETYDFFDMDDEP